MTITRSSAALRSESSDVAHECAAFASAVRDALAWINDDRNIELLSSNKQLLEFDLRRAAFQAKKLDRTMSRPMCVGVFGASQSGKSYLVSMLAAKGGQLVASFDNGRREADFLRGINPGGGQESTGLVTRFTVRAGDAPKGFPVAVRLLSQTEIVKILANTYSFEADLEFENLPSSKELDEKISELAKAVTANYTDVLREEDIWDLQDYFQKYLRRFEFVKAIDPFWERIAWLAPRLSLGDRANLYSIFWGQYQPITDLYLKLQRALASLGHAEDAFCELDELVLSKSDREKGKTSIIDVRSLIRLASEETDSIQLVTSEGIKTNLPKAVACALIAELQLELKDKPWDFFDYTDLLDFPGYRSRLPLRLNKLLTEEPADTLYRMFLRGKVDFLFQRYTADQELTSMLLCVEDSEQNVVSLPAVVEDWIGVAHGQTAEDRRDRPVLLFLCLTKFDRHLIDSPGNIQNDAARFEARVNASLLNQFGATEGSWSLNWTPGHPFNNCFWIRNPKYEGSAKIIESKNFQEIRLKGEMLDRLEALKSAYMTVENVRRHFKEPERAWDEVMKLNDGGVSYLAESLAKVCLPTMKVEQVRARLHVRRKQILERLSRYYISTDLMKRRAEREAVCDEIIQEVQNCIDHNRFGSLLRALCVDRVQLGDTIYSSMSDLEFGRLAKVAEVRSDGKVNGKRRGPIVRPPEKRSQNVPLGDVAVRMWAGNIQKISEVEAFSRAVGVSMPMLREIGIELSNAAHRKKLNETIAAQLDKRIHVGLNRDQKTDIATIVAAKTLNAFVATLGYDLLPVEARPKAEWIDGSEHAIFAPRSVVHDASGLGEEAAPFAYRYVLDWCTAFQDTARENASTEEGYVRDPVQNARLGDILQAFGSANS